MYFVTGIACERRWHRVGGDAETSADVKEEHTGLTFPTANVYSTYIYVLLLLRVVHVVHSEAALVDEEVQAGIRLDQQFLCERQVVGSGMASKSTENRAAPPCACFLFTGRFRFIKLYHYYMCYYFHTLRISPLEYFLVQYTSAFWHSTTNHRLKILEVSRFPCDLQTQLWLMVYLDDNLAKRFFFF